MTNDEAMNLIEVLKKSVLLGDVVKEALDKVSAMAWEFLSITDEERSDTIN